MQNIVNNIKKLLKKSDDFVLHESKTAGGTIVSLCLIENLVNSSSLGTNLIKPITEIEKMPTKSKIKFLQSKIAVAGSEISTNIEDIKIKLLSGYVCVFTGKNTEALIVPMHGFDKRAIDEPPTSAVLKGPREGFTEDLNTNISLIRRRIKSEDLVIKKAVLGKYTSTKIDIVYIDSIADKKVVKEVESRISKINIDGLIDSFYIQSLIEERKSLLFKQIGNTEKPDVLASKLLEGRVAVFMDGSPIVLTVPFLLLEDFQSGDDYYMHPARASFVRLIRLVGLIMAILLPGIYVALETFHYRVLPVNFLITIMSSIQSLSFPPLLEILFVLFLFEILNEASIRMPKYLGMALSIIGALILGQTAVEAGIISPPSVMMVAISGITLYTVPDQAATCSMLRLVFTIVGGVVGFYGILIGFVFLTTYLLSFDSYGTPYLAPYAPIIQNDKKDGIFKAKLVNMERRPSSFPNKNRVRMDNE